MAKVDVEFRIRAFASFIDVAPNFRNVESYSSIMARFRAFIVVGGVITVRCLSFQPLTMNGMEVGEGKVYRNRSLTSKRLRRLANADPYGLTTIFTELIQYR